MEFHINRSPDKPSVTSSASTGAGIENERLRKAIERNRAKQARRDVSNNGGMSTASRLQQRFEAGAANAQSTQAAASIPRDWQAPGRSASSNFEAAQNRFETANRQNLNSRQTTRSGVVSSAAASEASASTVTRRSVTGLNQEQQIIPTPRRPIKKSTANNIKYSSGKKSTSSRKKQAPIGSVGVRRLVKGAWIFCLVLFVRLIFTDGGIIDYYSTKNLLKLKINEVIAIRQENQNLIEEMERIKNDQGYQKKLVRDNLGFIASNEYLILFPKERL